MEKAQSSQHDALPDLTNKAFQVIFTSRISDTEVQRECACPKAARNISGKLRRKPRFSKLYFYVSNGRKPSVSSPLHPSDWTIIVTVSFTNSIYSFSWLYWVSSWWITAISHGLMFKRRYRTGRDIRLLYVVPGANQKEFSCDLRTRE